MFKKHKHIIVLTSLISLPSRNPAANQLSFNDQPGAHKTCPSCKLIGELN